VLFDSIWRLSRFVAECERLEEHMEVEPRGLFDRQTNT
jgi:hypothetical protein